MCNMSSRPSNVRAAKSFNYIVYVAERGKCYSQPDLVCARKILRPCRKGSSDTASKKLYCRLLLSFVHSKLFIIHSFTACTRYVRCASFALSSANTSIVFFTSSSVCSIAAKGQRGLWMR